MMCTYCDKNPTDQSALCAWHLDLEVLAEYLRDNNTQVTIPAIISLIAICQGNGGSLVITPDDLPGLITPAIVKQYGIVEATNDYR